MAAPNFSVTIVYESMEAGHRAERFSDQLIAEAAVDDAFELNLWNFGVLGIRGVRNATASAAAISDMVILSMSGTVPLPERAVEWIEMWTWLTDRRKPVLVALFGAQHRECTAIRAYPRRSAISKKLDFFPMMYRAASETKPNADFCNSPITAL